VKLPVKSIVALALTLIFVFFGDMIYTKNPNAINPDAILAPPSLEAPMGTDRLGRDVMARVIDGGKISIIIGVGSTLVASLIGLIVGVVAGYFRGVVDKGVVVLVDLFLTFPTFFLLLALISYMNASVLMLIIVISITGWMGTARLIRSESFGITDKPYIKILKIANVSKAKILFKYYLPALGSIFLISFIFWLGGAILAESGLSFLGLGIQPPQMSWGLLISEGREFIDIAWWVSFFPGLFIFLITMPLVNISDFLQHSFNKKEVV
jgi:peptide/nickel transport system permease protein